MLQWLSVLEKQRYQAKHVDNNQVEGDDLAQQARIDEYENTGDDGDDRRQYHGNMLFSLSFTLAAKVR